MKDDDAPGGWGYSNHTFLEGRGLEEIYFASSQFPPPTGADLIGASRCGDPHLKLTVSKCLAANNGAVACQVDVKDGKGICRSNIKAKGCEDIKNRRGVIMVQGRWDETGKWVDDKQAVTLSCDAVGGVDQALSADGAITACIREHRYDPAKHSKEFQACIRALRGDYCGDGTAHTTSGTDIDVFDKNLNKMTKNDCHDGRAFEASWTPDGAVCVAHVRWKGNPTGEPPCPKMGQPKNGVACLPGNPKPVVTTRSMERTCNGLNEADVQTSETDPICKG